MNGAEPADAIEVLAAARMLVGARRGVPGASGAGFRVPESISTAYAIQEAAIGLWREPVAGWKVGAVGEPWRGRHGIERLAGPVFQGNLQHAGTGECTVAVYEQGFAAVEAEFVFRIRAGAVTDSIAFPAENAAEVVESLHGGVEIASSPNPRINEFGPAAIAADFGNNAGLLVGPVLPRWREAEWEQLLCTTSVDGMRVGQGSAAAVPGGPLAALAFALNHCAARGRPLQAGQHVCTGATTGIHLVHPGQRAAVSFGEHGQVRCRIEAMRRR